MSGAESPGESRWKADDEPRGVEPEIEERDAERLAREAAEEAEDEDAPAAAAEAEDEAEW